MDRVVWIDVARGMSVALVVLYHTSLLLSQNGLGDPHWHDVDGALASLRMPLLFTVSGLLAGAALKRPWRSLWDSRLALLVWLVPLWAVLRFTAFSAVPMPVRPEETSVLRLLASPLWPSTGLWFLQALFAFLVLTKLASGRVPPVWQLAIAAVVSAAFFSGLSLRNLGYDGIGRYGFFFLVGVHGRELLMRLFADARPVWTAAALAVWIGLSMLIFQHGWTGAPLVGLAVAAVATVTGLLVARVLAATPLCAAFAYLGRNTLPVYVTHVALIALLFPLVLRIGTAVPTVWWPPLLGTVAGALSLVVHKLVSGTPLKYLYLVPPFLQFSAAERRAPLPVSVARTPGS